MMRIDEAFIDRYGPHSTKIIRKEDRKENLNSTFFGCMQ